MLEKRPIIEWILFIIAMQVASYILVGVYHYFDTRFSIRDVHDGVMCVFFCMIATRYRFAK